MRTRALALLLVLTLLLPAFTPGCTEDEDPGQYTTINDMADRQVKVPQDVGSAVGIGPGALRLMVYLGHTDKVVGVEDVEKTDPIRPYIMAHPELRNLPTIGPMHGGDAELIVAADPDIIFWTYTTADDANELQEKTGIPVVVLVYGDLDDQTDNFFRALELVEEVMGSGQNVEQQIQDTIQELSSLAENIPEENRSSLYVGGIGYKGTQGLLSTEPAFSSFGFLGLESVAADIGQDHAFIDKEQLLEWDPKIIFVDEGGLEPVMDELESDEAYQDLQAVQNGTIYGLLPYNWYTTNVGTLLANSYYLLSILAPEEFSLEEAELKADEIYLQLVGYKVYGEMKETFGGFKELELDRS